MPRGRPRKRLTRIHAAIDAMSPLGYGQEQVVSVIKKLLKEYGGDDGWPFIEDSAYMVLIDALLEEGNQEKAANGGDQLMDKPFDGNNDGAPETSTRVADVGKDIASQDGVEKPSDLTEEPTCSEVVSSSSGVNEAGTGNAAWQNILPPSGNIETGAAAKAACEATKHFPTEAAPQINNKLADLTMTSQDIIPLAPPMNASPVPRHRQPCYGWIESNDDSAIAFVYFKPASGVHGFRRPDEKLLPSEPPTGVRRKRKSRWDQRPTDA